MLLAFERLQLWHKDAGFHFVGLRVDDACFCSYALSRGILTFSASDLAFLKIADALFVGFRARLTPPWAPVGRASPIHERSTRQPGEAMVAGIGIRVHPVRDHALAARHRVNAENALV